MINHLLERSLFVITSTSYRLAREATNGRKVFAINLSAPFIIEFFSDQLSAVLLYADYVFCNESEAAKVTEIIK